MNYKILIVFFIIFLWLSPVSALIQVNPVKAEIDPGESWVFNITFVNPLKSAARTSMSVDLSGLPGAITPICQSRCFSNTSFVILANKNATVLLTIPTSVDLPAGRYYFNVKAFVSSLLGDVSRVESAVTSGRVNDVSERTININSFNSTTNITPVEQVSTQMIVHNSLSDINLLVNYELINQYNQTVFSHEFLEPVVVGINYFEESFELPGTIPPGDYDLKASIYYLSEELDSSSKNLRIFAFASVIYSETIYDNVLTVSLKNVDSNVEITESVLDEEYVEVSGSRFKALKLLRSAGFLKPGEEFCFVISNNQVSIPCDAPVSKEIVSDYASEYGFEMPVIDGEIIEQNQTFYEEVIIIEFPYLLGGFKNLTVINHGGLSIQKTLELTLQPLELAFISSKKPGSVLVDNKLYFTGEIAPGEGLSLYYETNYSILLLIPAGVFLGFLIFLYFNRKVDFSKTLVKYDIDDDKLKLKIMIKIRNVSKRNLTDIKVIEKLPSFVSEVGDFGTIDGYVDKSSNKVIWKVDKLLPGHEVIISYKMRTKLEIIGELKLSPAIIEYHIGKRKISKTSNSIIINAEEVSKK